MSTFKVLKRKDLIFSELTKELQKFVSNKLKLNHTKKSKHDSWHVSKSKYKLKLNVSVINILMREAETNQKIRAN